MSTQHLVRCAVIGNPISHSRSPEIHQAFAKQYQLKLSYERMLADNNDFVNHVQGFFAQGGKGLNITVPFKEKAFALATKLSPSAKLAGAVNTLWMEKGELHGCNTDGTGLVHDLKWQGYDPKGQRILLIGAGGAAKGVLLPLLNAGADAVQVVNRTETKAQALVNYLSEHQPEHTDKLSVGDINAVDGTWDIVINATSSGLDQQSPLSHPINFSAHSLAYDMVYGAEPTAFMKDCAHYGVTKCLDGLGMLVGQAAESFNIWHGFSPDTKPVLAILRQQLYA